MSDTTGKSPAPPLPVPSGPSSARASAWRVLDWLIWAYAAAIVAGWAWMYVEGDREWLATLVLFGPRWLCSLPLPFLAIAAAVGRRRWMLLVLAATAVFIAVPIMGFQVRLPARASGAPTLRIMTCNVDQRRFSVDALAQLIVDEQPDVVALQEVRYQTPFIWPPGWQAVEYDEFIVASRWPVRRDGSVRRPLRTDSASMRYVVDTPDGEVQVFDVHLSTPRPGLEAVLNRKTLIDPSRAAELEDVILSRSVEMGKTSDWIAQFAGSKIVAGDFNTPPDSTLFRAHWSWLENAFSAVGWGFGFTKNSEKDGWSYGARIDYVLFNNRWRCLKCWVGPDIGSDHLPLFADLESRVE